MQVVYACNKLYIRQTLVSIVSLIKYNQHVSITLIYDGLTQQDIKYIGDKVQAYTRDIAFVSIEEVLKEIPLKMQGRHPRTIYAKLYLQRVISGERVLYLDSDVIVNGSLDELENRDMAGELVAGVLMPYSVKIKDRVGLKSENVYICDGVVLINLREWKKHKISDTCTKYIISKDGDPYMMSEGVLNFVCKDRIGILPPKYNLMPSMIIYTQKQIVRLFEPVKYYDSEELAIAQKKPVLIHFMNELYNRPWYEPCDHPYKDKYRKFDIEIFGSREYKRRNVSLHTRITKILIRKIPFCVFSYLYHLKNR